MKCPLTSTQCGSPSVAFIYCVTSISAGQSANFWPAGRPVWLPRIVWPLRRVHRVASNVVLGNEHLAARSVGVRASEGMTVRFMEKEKTRRSDGRPASSSMAGMSEKDGAKGFSLEETA